MRLIDADALIDKYGDWYTEEGTEEGYIGTIRGIVESIPTIEPEPKWIPWNSGKLPKESGTYTVTAYDGATNRVTYAKYQKRLKRWELTGARAYWRVLAWMPLPEPYTEGEQ